MITAKRLIAFLLLWACMNPECDAGFKIKNAGEGMISIWYRKPTDSQWQNPVSLGSGEERELTIPSGIYKFCYLAPQRDYIYLVYSRYEAGQTYLVGYASAPCAGGGDQDLDVDTLPCGMYGLYSSGPQQERPDGAVRLGVNARICEKGIHVESVTQNTPAVRCFDRETGEAIQLEAEDHIIAVNGRKPKSIPEFQEVIQNSGRDIELKVLDGRTGKSRRLSTRLW